mmetsp:Transcript_11778/g.32249  ORF Transcript_11778/g.32249 Transcript_11778/m.32249 type:complete len:293 (+) Transcript_11778:114-992(+)
MAAQQQGRWQAPRVQHREVELEGAHDTRDPRALLPIVRRGRPLARCHGPHTSRLLRGPAHGPHAPARPGHQLAARPRDPCQQLLPLESLRWWEHAAPAAVFALLHGQPLLPASGPWEAPRTPARRWHARRIGWRKPNGSVASALEAGPEDRRRLRATRHLRELLPGQGSVTARAQALHAQAERCQQQLQARDLRVQQVVRHQGGHLVARQPLWQGRCAAVHGVVAAVPQQGGRLASLWAGPEAGRAPRHIGGLHHRAPSHELRHALVWQRHPCSWFGPEHAHKHCRGGHKHT